MGTNRELVAAASLAARAAASNRSMKISAIIAVPSIIRSTRLDGRAELSVQVRPVSTTVLRCSWSICPLRKTCYFVPNICSSLPLMAGVHRDLRRIGKSEHDGGAGRVRSRCSSQGISKAKRPTRETPRQKAMD